MAVQLEGLTTRTSGLAQRVDLLDQGRRDVTEQMGDLDGGPGFVKSRPRDAAQEFELCRRESTRRMSFQ